VLVATKDLAVRVEHDRVLARNVGANGVVCERLVRVEIEDEEQIGTLERDQLVVLVLARHVRLRALQPMILALERIHRSIKAVQKLVAQEIVIHEVVLTPRIVVAAYRRSY